MSCALGQSEFNDTIVPQMVNLPGDMDEVLQLVKQLLHLADALLKHAADDQQPLAFRVITIICLPLIVIVICRLIGLLLGGQPKRDQIENETKTSSKRDLETWDSSKSRDLGKKKSLPPEKLELCELLKLKENDVKYSPTLDCKRLKEADAQKWLRRRGINLRKKETKIVVDIPNQNRSIPVTLLHSGSSSDHYTIGGDWKQVVRALELRVGDLIQPYLVYEARKPVKLLLVRKEADPLELRKPAFSMHQILNNVKDIYSELLPNIDHQ